VLISLGIVMIWLSSCETKTTDLPPMVQIICPRLIEYSPELLAKAADEVDALPQNSALVVLLNDYGGQRNRARACRVEDKQK